MTTTGGAEWIVVVTRLPAQPSRHRVAVWRELRRAGALALGGGTWLFPAAGTSADVVDRVRTLVERADDGELLVLDARSYDPATDERLRTTHTAAVEAEWIEFLADCAKFDAEIDKEVARRKFTLAELEEEEQSLDRLRRWHRAIALRDRFGAASGPAAAAHLERCVERLDAYAQLVYDELGP